MRFAVRRARSGRSAAAAALPDLRRRPSRGSARLHDADRWCARRSTCGAGTGGPACAAAASGSPSPWCASRWAGSRDWSWRAPFDADGSCTVTVRADADGPADRGAGGARRPGGRRAPVGRRPRRPHRRARSGGGRPAHGDQHLYDLAVELLADGAVVDRIDHRIGLREVELVQEPDEAGSSFGFRVNGVPILRQGRQLDPRRLVPGPRRRVEQLRDPAGDGASSAA